MQNLIDLDSDAVLPQQQTTATATAGGRPSTGSNPPPLPPSVQLLGDDGSSSNNSRAAQEQRQRKLPPPPPPPTPAGGHHHHQQPPLVPLPATPKKYSDYVASTHEVVVHIVRAVGVAAMSRKGGRGTSDCLAVVSSTTVQNLFTTKVAKRTVNPVWNQWFKHKPDIVTIEVFHHTFIGENKSLGYATLTIPKIIGTEEHRLPLMSRPNSEVKATGDLLCFLLPVPPGDTAAHVFEQHIKTIAACGGVDIDPQCLTAAAPAPSDAAVPSYSATPTRVQAAQTTLLTQQQQQQQQQQQVAQVQQEREQAQQQSAVTEEGVGGNSKLRRLSSSFAAAIGLGTDTSTTTTTTTTTTEAGISVVLTPAKGPVKREPPARPPPSISGGKAGAFNPKILTSPQDPSLPAPRLYQQQQQQQQQQQHAPFQLRPTNSAMPTVTVLNANGGSHQLERTITLGGRGVRRSARLSASSGSVGSEGGGSDEASSYCEGSYHDGGGSSCSSYSHGGAYAIASQAQGTAAITDSALKQARTRESGWGSGSGSGSEVSASALSSFDSRSTREGAASSASASRRPLHLPSLGSSTPSSASAKTRRKSAVVSTAAARAALSAAAGVSAVMAAAEEAAAKARAEAEEARTDIRAILRAPRRSKRAEPVHKVVLPAGTAAAAAAAKAAAEGKNGGGGGGGEGSGKILESFFVVQAADYAEDIREPIGEYLATGRSLPNISLCEIAFSGEVTDVYPAAAWKSVPSSTWMFCFPEGLYLSPGPRPTPEIFPFRKTSFEGDATYITCLKCYVPVSEEKLDDLYEILNTSDDFSEVELYTPVCYCVETTTPCYSFCREWLRNFWERGFGGPSIRDPNFSIAAAVAYLKEVPRPIPAGNPLKITCDGKTFTELSIPLADYIPCNDVPLKTLFRALSIKTILEIYRTLILEDNVFILSKSKTLLTYVGESFQKLLYPFKWSTVYIPLMPPQLSEFTRAPMAVLVGVTKPAFELPEGLVVDLDADVIVRHTGKTRDIPLPAVQYAEAVQDLQPYLMRECDVMDEYTWDSTSGGRIAAMSDRDYNRCVSAAFLKLVMNILQGYRRSFCYFRVFPVPKIDFDAEVFAAREGYGKDAEPFFRAFCISQAFVNFAEAHKWPHPNLFDRTLERSREAWALSVPDIAAYLKTLAQPWETLPPITANIVTTSPGGAAAAAAAEGAPKSNGNSDSSKENGDEDGSDSGSEDSESRREAILNIAAIDAVKVPPTFLVKPDKCIQDESTATAAAVRAAGLDEGSSTGISSNNNGSNGGGGDDDDVSGLGEEEDEEEGNEGDEEEEDGDDEEDGVNENRKIIDYVADYIVDGEPDKITADIHSEVCLSLTKKEERVEFAECFIDRNGKKATELNSQAFRKLSDYFRIAVTEAIKERDYYSPQFLIEAADLYFRISKGASEFVASQLKGMEIWNEQKFWESYFNRKVHEVCVELYKPSIEDAMRKWGSMNQTERDEVVRTEVETIWALMNNFSMRMANLAVSTSLMKKFAIKAASATQMDSEHTSTYMQLVKKMELMNIFNGTSPSM